MSKLADINRRRARFMDSMLHAFEDHLREIVLRAQGRVTARLQQKLAIEDGVILQRAGNLRTLRGLSALFMQEMDRAGFSRLVEAFAREFPQQLPFLTETLDYLSANMKIPLPSATLTARDVDLLGGFQASAVSSIEAAVEAVASGATTRGMFVVGGLPFADLVTTLTQKFETSIARARTLAETSQATFYRVATDRTFQVIEKGLAEDAVRYRYTGPVDKLERPFCRRLTDAGKAYTRAQIDAMSNGQLPNVFLTGGGWSCRHAWVLDTSALEARISEAA